LSSVFLKKNKNNFYLTKKQTIMKEDFLIFKLKSIKIESIKRVFMKKTIKKLEKLVYKARLSFEITCHTIQVLFEKGKLDYY